MVTWGHPAAGGDCSRVRWGAGSDKDVVGLGDNQRWLRNPGALISVGKSDLLSTKIKHRLWT